ncbi:MAG: hypothetical protein JWM11_2940 [Planctomycetaceae bacterium]|nr:hypothetical protein [Planctomycetaceae bacterium]
MRRSQLKSVRSKNQWQEKNPVKPVHKVGHQFAGFKAGVRSKVEGPDLNQLLFAHLVSQIGFDEGVNIPVQDFCGISHG